MANIRKMILEILESHVLGIFFRKWDPCLVISCEKAIPLEWQGPVCPNM